VKKRRALQIALAALTTVAIGAVVLSRLAWEDVRRLPSDLDPIHLVLGFAAYLMANVLRALRFRTLVGERLSTLALLRVVIIQNFLNTFLPFRAGEVSYLYLVHKSGSVSLGGNLGSLLGARLLDLLTALVIPLATIPLSRGWASDSRPALWFGALALGTGLALALGILASRPLAEWFGRRIGTGRAWLDRGLALARDILLSLHQLRGRRVLGRVALLSFGCWGLIYLSGYLLMSGADLKLSLWDCLFAYGFPVLVSMTPFYMLGGFGAYEGSVGVGLVLVGIAESRALAVGLFMHLAELLFVVLLALPVFLWPRRGTAPEQDT
jgi:uncharacterized membrane protein YbhN (UPF0104 family)